MTDTRDKMKKIHEKRDDLRRDIEAKIIEGLANQPQEHPFSVAAQESKGLPMRQFETGATRNVDDENFDYEGFLSPLVLERFAEYMHEHRVQADGNLRASDNWQNGIPLDSYMKSGFRHFMDWWLEHRGTESREGLEKALCALLFNVQGYLHETLKAKS